MHEATRCSQTRSRDRRARDATAARTQRTTDHPLAGARRAIAARTADRTAAWSSDAYAGHRRPLAAVAGDGSVARPDFSGGLSSELSRGDDRLEVGERGVVIMRARGV